MSDDTHIYAPVAYTYSKPQVPQDLIIKLLKSVEDYINWINVKSDCLSESKQEIKVSKLIEQVKQTLK